MTKEDFISLIEKNYIQLSNPCKKDLIEVSRLLYLDKEEKLVSEGQYSDKTYLIGKGCCRAYYIKNSKDVTEWFAFENEFISAINSFFLQVPSPIYVETIEPSVAIEISRDHLFMLSNTYQEINQLEKMILTKTVLQLQARLASIQFESAMDKYENLLRERPDFPLRVPLTHIASYMGITLETLSRIRNKRRI